MTARLHAEKRELAKSHYMDEQPGSNSWCWEDACRANLKGQFLSHFCGLRLYSGRNEGKATLHIALHGDFQCTFSLRRTRISECRKVDHHLLQHPCQRFISRLTPAGAKSYLLIEINRKSITFQNC
jgi:hypothetical protein